MPARDHQVLNRRADLLDLAMRKLDRIHNALFRNLLRAGLDHHDAVLGADDHDVQRALLTLGIGRIHDELVVDDADAHCAHRAVKRNVAQRKRTARAIDPKHIRIIFLIRGVDECNHLRLVAEGFRKQRTNRTIDLTAGQDLLLARTSFALDESAWNASTGIRKLTIFHRQREEVDAFFRIGRGDSSRQHHVISARRQRGAGGLLGHAPRLKFDLLAAGKLYNHVLLHSLSLFSLVYQSLGLGLASFRFRGREKAQLTGGLLCRQRAALSVMIQGMVPPGWLESSSFHGN